MRKLSIVFDVGLFLLCMFLCWRSFHVLMLDKNTAAEGFWTLHSSMLPFIAATWYFWDMGWESLNKVWRKL